MIQIISIEIISLVFILVLIFALFVQITISNELKDKNNELKSDLEYQKQLNQVLKYDLKFEKTLSKTFSDGLEALTKNKK